jgi:hypothetical protein
MVTKSKEVKTGCNLVESSKEDCLKTGCFANDDDDDDTPHSPLFLE